jgi:membrane dipeptidase
MESPIAAAEQLLRRVPLIDGHNDLAWAVRANESLSVADLDRLQPSLQTDLVRLQKGRVGGQFWSVYVPCRFKGSDAVTVTFEQIEFVHRMIERYPSRLSLATSAAQVEDAFATGRVASLLGAEGGHCIGDSLEILRAFYRLGVRYLTLTHNENTSWAESATDVSIGGLGRFGYEVISEMNLLGMLVDLAHTSRSTALAGIETSRAPVVITHSSCRGVVDHPRNVDDETMRALADAGGVLMLTFVPSFISAECADWDADLRQKAVSRGMDPRNLDVMRELAKEQQLPRPKATLFHVIDHLEYAREMMGVESIGLGGDYDGMSEVPVGLEDVSCYPALFAALLERGWSVTDCAKLAGGNILRVMHEAESVAKSLAR